MSSCTDKRDAVLPPLGLMALAMGVSVANPFYSQSLLPTVKEAFGLPPSVVLLGPMATQLGLALGYLLVLPLGDSYERRRLLTQLAVAMAVGCTAVVLAPNFAVLLPAWFLLGLFALIPALLPTLLAAFTPEESRGRMLGIVLSGQLSGIVLSRSISGLIAQVWGWRSVYALSAIAMMAVALLFQRRLPRLQATEQQPYWQLQASLFALWSSYSQLRRACLSYGLLFGAYMALWSALALHLAAPPWQMGTAQIGGFGLVGLSSIVAAPWTGRWIDRSGPDRVVMTSVVCCSMGVLLLGLLPGSLPALATGMMALGLGVQANLLGNQARIYALNPASRSRMSGQLYLIAYLGAAACSATTAALWSHLGWLGTCSFALVMIATALVVERQRWRPETWGKIK